MQTTVILAALGVVTFLLIISIVYVLILKRQAQQALAQQLQERREAVRLRRKTRKRWFEASTKLVRESYSSNIRIDIEFKTFKDKSF